MVRPWFAIPAAGAIGAIVGALVGGVPLAIAMGLAAAAMTGAVRSMIGDSPAALAAAIVAGGLVVAILVDRDVTNIRQTLAIAALAWTIAELSRPTLPDATPIVAMLPAIVAGVLDASLISLVPIAGLRLVTSPWKRPRWIPIVPFAGGVATLVAVILMVTHRGDLWAGRPLGPVAADTLATRALETLGPFVVVAAIAGLAAIGGRGRYAQATLVAAIAGSILSDIRAGSIGAPTIALAALFGALAIGRLAGAIRFPAGQAILAATIGLVVTLPPAYARIDRHVAVSSLR